MKKSILLISILILLSFTACGQNSETEKTDKSETTASEITTSKSDDGKQLGYITKLYEKNGAKYLDIDYIEWLSGEAAIKAIMEDYDVSKKDAEEMYTNDYYIRNQSTKIRTFKISDAAAYTEIKDNPEGVKSDFNEMKKRLETPDTKLLCHITIKNEEVIDIQQQYQP